MKIIAIILTALLSLSSLAASDLRITVQLSPSPSLWQEVFVVYEDFQRGKDLPPISKPKIEFRTSTDSYHLSLLGLRHLYSRLRFVDADSSEILKEYTIPGDSRTNKSSFTLPNKIVKLIEEGGNLAVQLGDIEYKEQFILNLNNWTPERPQVYQAEPIILEQE